MTDEQSPEATVAGEAAAAAVEELHSREEVAETAVTAVIAASDAESTAEVAFTQASAASETAAIAADLAVEAQQSATEAQQAVYLTAEALETIQAQNDAKLREMREYIDSRIPLPVQAAESSDVQEIEVNDGTARVSDSGGESDSGDSAEKSPEARAPRQEKYGLRARRHR
jgi:hypothetical protein